MEEKKVNIYVLINPISGNVFYVGATLYPDERLKQHTYEGKYADSFKTIQINKIVAAGLEVEILVVDECHISEASYWEDFYSQLFKVFGFELPKFKRSTYTSNYIYGKTFKTKIKKIPVRIREDVLDAVKIVCGDESAFIRAFIEQAVRKQLKRYLNGDSRCETIVNALDYRFIISNEKSPIPTP